MKLLEHVELAARTTMGVGGAARYYIECDNDADVIDAAAFAKEHSRVFFILGKGSNTIFPDGLYENVIISLTANTWRVVSKKNDEVEIVADAGLLWDDLVAQTIKQGFCGLENLSLIPGVVGAAPVQNIGAYGVELQDIFLWADVVDTKDGGIKRLSKNDCAFTYRDSIFKHSTGQHYIIVRVAFALSKTWRPRLDYPDIARFCETQEIVSAEEARQVVINIRQNKLPPPHLGTAGSFFKNPIVSQQTAQELKIRFPEMPSFEQPSGEIKLSAGWLLDHVCGLKGYREGDVGLYEKQALVVVHYGGAKTADVLSFAKNISKKFFEKTNIHLEFEVRIISS